MTQKATTATLSFSHLHFWFIFVKTVGLTFISVCTRLLLPVCFFHLLCTKRDIQCRCISSVIMLGVSSKFNRSSFHQIDVKPGYRLHSAQWTAERTTGSTAAYEAWKWQRGTVIIANMIINKNYLISEAPLNHQSASIYIEYLLILLLI